MDASLAARAPHLCGDALSQPSMLSCPTEQTGLLYPVMPAAIVEAAEMYAVVRRYNNNNNYTFPVRRLGVFRDDLMITR